MQHQELRILSEEYFYGELKCSKSFKFIKYLCMQPHFRVLPDLTFMCTSKPHSCVLSVSLPCTLKPHSCVLPNLTFMNIHARVNYANSCGGNMKANVILSKCKCSNKNGGTVILNNTTLSDGNHSLNTTEKKVYQF